ncbi:hypothetical protein HDU93_002813, partial [Gonapodya sp. JEL0774]
SQAIPASYLAMDAITALRVARYTDPEGKLTLDTPEGSVIMGGGFTSVREVGVKAKPVKRKRASGGAVPAGALVVAATTTTTTSAPGTPPASTPAPTPAPAAAPPPPSSLFSSARDALDTAMPFIVTAGVVGVWVGVGVVAAGAAGRRRSFDGSDQNLLSAQPSQDDANPPPPRPAPQAPEANPIEVSITVRHPSHASRIVPVPVEIAKDDEKQGDKKESLKWDTRQPDSDPEHCELQDDEPPDGGFQAWGTVVAYFITGFFTIGSLFSWSVYLRYYFQNKTFNNASQTLYTLTGGLCNAAGYIVAPFLGTIADRHGYNVVVLGGSITVFLSYIITSFAGPDQVWMVVVFQGAVLGVGSQACWMIAFAAIPGWFSKRRGLAMSLGSTGSGLGGLAMTNLTQYLFVRVGHVWTLRITGFMVLG